MELSFIMHLKRRESSRSYHREMLPKIGEAVPGF
jgi:hypothetical protein